MKLLLFTWLLILAIMAYLLVTQWLDPRPEVLESTSRYIGLLWPLGFVAGAAYGHYWRAERREQFEAEEHEQAEH